MGIEPTSQAWEARILPMNYARTRDVATKNFIATCLRCSRDFD